MKKTILILSLLAAPAFADITNYKKEDVVWLSGTLGQTSINNNKALNVNFDLGYDFNENFALYTGLGSIRNSNSSNINYAEFGMKYTYHINDSWKVHSTLAGTSTLSNKASGIIQPKLGLGFGYKITPRFETHLTFNHLANLGLSKNLKKDANQITWGLTYYFGRPKIATRNIQQIKIYK